MCKCTGVFAVDVYIYVVGWLGLLHEYVSSFNRAHIYSSWLCSSTAFRGCSWSLPSNRPGALRRPSAIICLPLLRLFHYPRGSIWSGVVQQLHGPAILTILTLGSVPLVLKIAQYQMKWCSIQAVLHTLWWAQSSFHPMVIQLGTGSCVQRIEVNWVCGKEDYQYRNLSSDPLRGWHWNLQVREGSEVLLLRPPVAIVLEWEDGYLSWGGTYCIVVIANSGEYAIYCWRVWTDEITVASLEVAISIPRWVK